MVVGDVVHRDRGQGGEQCHGVGPLDREQRRLVGDVAQPDVGPALLGDDVLPVLGDVRRVDDQHHLVVEAVHETIVHERPLLGEQPRVLRLAGLERRHVVAGDALHERVAVGPGDLELSHVGHVEHAHSFAHRLVLGADARGVGHRHLEAGEGHDFRPQGHVDVVERGALERGGRRRFGHRSGDHPIKVASSAFCTCSRFSASSHTRDCRPSITSADTSSPRWAGRQCRKMAFGAASFISSASTV